MAGGRTIWWGKDSAWWRRERVVELGEEFGSDGPAVLDWLSCEAQAQNDGGVVKAGRRTLARGCFVEVVTVGHVLSRCVTLGLLEDFSDETGLFTCRISGWKADQERARSAARKAKERANQDSLSRSVTESHAEVATRPVKERAKALSPERVTDGDKANCRLLGEMAKQHNPKFKVKSPSRWLDDMRKLRELDENTDDEIAQAIRWVFTDSSDDATFWSGVIRSPGNLREHFPTIWGRLQRPRSNGTTHQPVQSAASVVQSYRGAP